MKREKKVYSKAGYNQTKKMTNEDKKIFLQEFLKAMQSFGFKIEEIYTEQEINNKSKKRN